MEAAQGTGESGVLWASPNGIEMPSSALGGDTCSPRAVLEKFSLKVFL